MQYLICHCDHEYFCPAWWGVMRFNVLRRTDWTQDVRGTFTGSHVFYRIKEWGLQEEGWTCSSGDFVSARLSVKYCVHFFLFFLNHLSFLHLTVLQRVVLPLLPSVVMDPINTDQCADNVLHTPYSRISLFVVRFGVKKKSHTSFHCGVSPNDRLLYLFRFYISIC